MLLERLPSVWGSCVKEELRHGCGNAHQIVNELVTCLHEILDKLHVEFVSSVPRSARQGNGGSCWSGVAQKARA